MKSENGIDTVDQVRKPVFQQGWLDGSGGLRWDLTGIKDAKRLLYEFTQGNLGFENLVPFSANLADLPHTETFAYSLYIGGTKRNNSYFNIRLPQEVISAPTVYILPQQYTSGSRHYRWLDIYTRDDIAASEDAAPVSVCKLNPKDEKYRFKYQGWHSLEEELLDDYVKGKIGFEDLMQIRLVNKGVNSLKGYLINRNPKLKIILEYQSDLQVGDLLAFIPGRHLSAGYEWIDIVNLSRERSELMTGYELDMKSGSLNGVHWPGIERRLLQDFLNGSPNVSADELLPIRQKVGGRVRSLTLVSVDRRQVSLEIPPGSNLQEGDEVVFTPKTTHGYTWFEAAKSGETDSSNMPISTGHVQYKSINWGWNGVELQMLRDYADGKRDFSGLAEVTLQATRAQMLNLWKEGKQKVYIVPSLKFGITQGERISLVPIVNENGQPQFQLRRGDTVLGVYDFDLVTRKFQIREILYTIDEFKKGQETGIYIYEDEEYAVATYFHRKHRSGKRVNAILESLAEVKGPNKRAKTLFKISEFNEAFQGENNLDTEVANFDLEKLLD